MQSRRLAISPGRSAGGAGDNDVVGGILGVQQSGSITASYATGDVAGGAGDNDTVGEVLGARIGGSITASYGFGMTNGGRNVGYTSLPTGVSNATMLAASNVGAIWTNADYPANAWEFGDGAPKLLYGDYDGTGDVFGCSGEVTILVPNCGSRLPGQL